MCTEEKGWDDVIFLMYTQHMPVGTFYLFVYFFVFLFVVFCLHIADSDNFFLEYAVSNGNIYVLSIVIAS